MFNTFLKVPERSDHMNKPDFLHVANDTWSDKTKTLIKQLISSSNDDSQKESIQTAIEAVYKEGLKDGVALIYWLLGDDSHNN